MTYLFADIHISPYVEDYADILSSMLGEIGFDTFEPTDTGIKAYIQKDLFVEEQLTELLSTFIIPDVSFTYEMHEMEDCDYNEEWEREHFDPILEREFGLRLDPRMAFGSGSHSTTHQLVSLLMDMDFNGQDVLDMGCGTGVLGIAMGLKGAKHVTAIDIDNMSVDNTIHNFSLNFPSSIDILTPICGDASAIDGTFHTIVANIFKTILIRDLPVYVDHLADDGTLIMSGFYTSDAPDIIEAAATCGLRHSKTCSDEDWAVLTFKK